MSIRYNRKEGNMTANIKTLTIGSHVSVDGKPVRVCGITKRKIGYHHPDERQNAHLHYARIHEVEPVPLTPDLLKELRFEWHEDSSCWRKYQNYDGEDYDWGIYAYNCDGGTWCFSLYLPDFCIKPQLYANHLHELEGQLAYYGVELIQD